MRPGLVIGKVTLSEDDPAFAGARWLVVSPLDARALAAGAPYAMSAQPSVVVYDELGAGRGDVIGFVEGAEATMPFDLPTPLDAYNVCILDQVNYHPPGAPPPQIPEPAPNHSVAAAPLR